VADPAWRVYANGATWGNPGPATDEVVVDREVCPFGKALGERAHDQAACEALTLAVRSIRTGGAWRTTSSPERAP
jgi:hypothetical protein